MVLIFLNKNFIKMGFSFLGQSIVCFFSLSGKYQISTGHILTLNYNNALCLRSEI